MCQKLIEAPKEVAAQQEQQQQQQAPTALVYVTRQIIVDDNNNSVDDHEDNHNHKHDRSLAQSLAVNKRPVERQQQMRKPQQASRSRNMILPINNGKTNNNSSITGTSREQKHRHRQVAPLASLDCSITEPVSGVESPPRTPTETPTLSGYFDCDQLSDMIDDSLFEITNTGCLSQSVSQQRQKQQQHQPQILNTADNNNNTATNNDDKSERELKDGENIGEGNVADSQQTPTNESTNPFKMDQNNKQENQTALESSIKSSVVKNTALAGVNKATTLVNYYQPYDYSSTSKIPNSTLSASQRNASCSVRLATNDPILSPNLNPSINKQRSKSARFSSTTLTAANNPPSSSYATKSYHNGNNHNRLTPSSQVLTNHHQHQHHYHRAHNKSNSNKQVESFQQQQQQRVRRKTRSNPDVRDDSELRKNSGENVDDSGLCAICREQEVKKKKDGKKRFTFSLFNLFTGGSGGNGNRNQSSGGGGSGSHATMCIHKQNFTNNDSATTSSMKQAGSNQVKGISLLSNQSSSSSSSAASLSSSSASSSTSSSSSTSAETTIREATNNSSPNCKPTSTSSQRLNVARTRKKNKTNTNGVGSHIKSRDSIRLTNQRKQRNIKAENQQQQQNAYNFKVSNSYTNFRNDSSANSELLLDFPSREQQTNGNNILKTTANTTAGELRASQSSYSIQQQQRKGSGRANNGKLHNQQQQQPRQAKCVKFTTPDRVMILPSSSSNHKTSGTQANLPPADLQPPAPIIKRSVPKSSSYSQTESNKNLYEMLARYEGNSNLISEINEKLKLTETIASPMSALDLEEKQQQQREEEEDGEEEKRQEELLMASNSNSNSNSNSDSNFNPSTADARDDYVDTNINCLPTSLVPVNNITISNNFLADAQPQPQQQQQSLEGFTQQSTDIKTFRR